MNICQHLRNQFAHKIKFLHLNSSTRIQRVTVLSVLSGCYIFHHHRNIAYCESSASLHQQQSFLPSNLILQRPSDLVTIDQKVVETSQTWLEWFSNLWNKIVWVSSLAFRSLELLTIYSPTFLTSPILLVNSSYYTDLWWRAFKYSISIAGPCHIKFAQWVATRPDLFPDYVCKCFSELQSSTDYELITLPELKKVLTAEYGENWEESIKLQIVPKPKSSQKFLGYTPFHVSGSIKSNEDSSPSSENVEWVPAIAGGGCIAQVYQAKALLPEYSDPSIDISNNTNIPLVWKDVVLKITHPNIKNIIVADLELMRIGVNLLEYLIPDTKHVSLVDSVEEFVPIMINQVNMKIEAKNLLRFRKNFHNRNHYNLSRDTDDLLGTFILEESILQTGTNRQDQDIIINEEEQGLTRKLLNFVEKMAKVFLDNKVGSKIFTIVDKEIVNSERSKDMYNVYFPEPILSFTTENVLMETYEEGVLIRDFLENYCTDRDKKLIGKYGLNAVLKMVFLDNFVHADLHPGNILMIRPPTFQNDPTSNDSDFRLCFIDSGIIATLNKQDQKNLIELFDAVIRNDGYRVGKLMIERSRFPGNISKDNKEKFSLEMDKLVSDVHKVGLKCSKIDINQLLTDVLKLCYSYQIKLESRFAVIILAMGIVEGLGKKVDPNVDILASAAPFVAKAMIQQISSQISKE